MINQLRVYRIDPALADVFHTRFRDHATRLMTQHGFRILAMWEERREEELNFVYLLAWTDEAEMRERWAAFMADAEWDAIKVRSRGPGGEPVQGVTERVLHAVPYSAPIEPRA